MAVTHIVLAIVALAEQRTNASGRMFLAPQVRAHDRIESIAESVELAAQRHGLDPYLLLSLVWYESAFRSDAVSPVGCVGITQLCGVKKQALLKACAELSQPACDDVALLLGAAELRKGIDTCGSEAGGVSYYRIGHCGLAESYRVRQVLATRGELAWGLQ